MCERGPVLFGDVRVAASVLLEQTWLYKLSTPKIHYGSDSNGNSSNRLVQTVMPSVYLCVFTIEKQSDGCVWAYTGSWWSTIFGFQKKYTLHRHGLQKSSIMKVKMIILLFDTQL